MSSIDLKEWSGRVYIGKDNGRKARSFFKLDELDSSNQYPIHVKLPENSMSMTSSFFMGLFSESIKRAGTKDVFYERFDIKAPNILRKSIDSAINHVLLTLRPNASIM